MPLALVVVAIVGLAVTGNLFSTSPYVIAVQVIAVALNLWARLSFDKGTFRVSAAPAGDVCDSTMRGGASTRP